MAGKQDSLNILPKIHAEGALPVKKSLMKQHIWESFYELSFTIPFDKLTVEQIIRHSGVSRATFYRHFHDKFDVLNYNVSAILEHLVGSRQCRGWQDFLFFLFQEIDRDKDYYRRAFKTNGQNAHSRFLYEFTFGFVKDRYLEALGRPALDGAEHYLIAHYCHGCVDCLEDWLRDPNPLGVRQIAELYYAVMPEQIRRAWCAGESCV